MYSRRVTPEAFIPAQPHLKEELHMRWFSWCQVWIGGSGLAAAARLRTHSIYPAYENAARRFDLVLPDHQIKQGRKLPDRSGEETSGKTREVSRWLVYS